VSPVASYRFCGAAIVFVLGTLFSPPIEAQEDKEFPIRLHGFFLGNVAARTGSDHPTGEEGGRFILADGRLRLEASGDTGGGSLSFLFKGDLFYDGVSDDAHGLVREAYADVSRGWLDLRVGRQIVTWGVGDLLFINDVFPKDWAAFFSGRPLEYLKVGVDAAKAHIDTRALNAEIVVIPFFEPDNLPGAERFFFFDPFATIRTRVLEEPATTAGNTELALRLYGRVLNSDVSFYAYRGYWRQPSFRPDELPVPTRLGGFYARLNTYGVTVQRSLGAAVLNVEAGYYDSRDDPEGVDPVVPNSQYRLLAGYQRQLASELSLGAQYYAEILENYAEYLNGLPPQLSAQDRVRHLLTVRLTQFLKYQTWKLSLFSFYGPSDRDFLLIPEVWHAITDRLSFTVGANIFAGENRTTFLGQLDANDNVFVAVRLDF